MNGMEKIDRFESLPVTENLLSRIPWKEISLSLLLPFLFLPMAKWMGLCYFVEGARYYAPHAFLDLFLYGTAFLVAVHSFLVWPLTAEQTWEHLKKMPMALQIGIPTFLMTLPLLGFSYWLVDIKDNLSLLELLIQIVPGIILGALLFQRTEKPWVFTLIAGVGAFIPLFVMNDLLSPFPVVFAYASKGAAFYFWKTVLPLGLTLLLIGLFWNSEKVELDLAIFAGALNLMQVVCFLILPLFLMIQGELSFYSPYQREVGFMMFTVVCYLILKRNPKIDRLLQVSAALSSLLALGWLIWFSNHLSYRWEEMIRVTHSVLVLGLAVAVFGVVKGGKETPSMVD